MRCLSIGFAVLEKKRVPREMGLEYRKFEMDWKRHSATPSGIHECA
jgi:hypothetical protein